MNLSYSKILSLGFFFIFLFFFYFVLLDFYKNESDIKAISKGLYKLKAEKGYLEGTVDNFRGPDIDKDLLETQARQMIASLNSKEIVFFWKEVEGENLNVYNS